ncbi:aminodeoxychorismate lyase [Marinobacterium nitratireducens]|uniref:Aminodeoxychorismate lyase n=1 Tax=Marinobacterium nitratireducens TaxID=518897 RepID=A0A917ZNH5_9GAMM|nr:aminodeoxychorismate lyase [Marinobacterium nitratireducens]GGO87067.1 aminodeoxychorismate lyase [Marinobacterium nitratireducens]
MISDTLTLVDGEVGDSLPLGDRGLAYGDGLFETIQLLDGRALLLDAHLKRLRRGCERLAIPPQPLLTSLRADIARLGSDGELARYGVLKILVTRGVGGRGYLPPPDPAPTRVLMLSQRPEYPDDPAQHGVRIRLCQLRLAQSPWLAGIKHLSRLEQVLARAEWRDPAIREGLLLDQDRYLVEGTMSNLLWVSQGRLCTPRLDLCGVEGVVRNHLLSRASEIGLEVEEGRYPLSQLEAADEVMLCNSLIDIWPVVALDARSWAPGAVTRRLQGLLKEDYLAC